MRIFTLLFFLLLVQICATNFARSEPMIREELAGYITPPFSLGKVLNDKGVYSLLNSGGAEAGFVFETAPLAPLPGFSGALINILVVLDLEGKFLDVRLIEQNEPIFTSGLGEATFHKFFEQYPGLSISSSLVVGTPYGSSSVGSSLVYLDGVTKATASVRIAHESVMAATLAVAREKIKGLATTPPAYPNPDYNEALSWADLVEKGLITHKQVTNAEINTLFTGTLWEGDDPEANEEPDELYLDLWVVDLGPQSIARAVLSDEGYNELQEFLKISPYDEPILLIEAGRHGLVSEGFVRNTSPDRLSAEQGGLPIALRDSDLFVDLADGLPDGIAMILRTDRRLGFDPASDWILNVSAIRSDGMLQPQIGKVILPVNHVTDERFFLRPVVVAPTPAWLDALRNRQTDIIILGVFLTLLVVLLLARMNPLANSPAFTPYRLVILAFVTVFVGWWGQGQLSIVTILGSIRTLWEGGSFAFLLYDPFSLLIWAIAIFGFFTWGRGLFCGWLCPFGALQEFSHHLGRLVKLPRFDPSPKWDIRLKNLKYLLLFGMIGVVFISPDHIDKVAEIEPFKTAITTFFMREWYYFAYASIWLISGMVLFKGFCRYICQLGAVMAIGGLIRGRNWIKRRAECGSPCQLCKVKCSYGAIKKSGAINYSECFQCLDCVVIHNDETRCVPQIVAIRKNNRLVSAQ